MMLKSVFILLDSSGCGGIESHVLVLAQALTPHCSVQVLLWRLYQESHPLLPKLTAAGIRYQVLDGSFIRLVRLWQSDTDTILHCHGYKANLLGRAAGLLLRRRCVCTFHNGDLGEGRVRLYTRLDEWSSRFSYNIAVSRAISRRLAHHCLLMPNVVTVEQDENVSAHQVGDIAFVGRLEQVKRPDRFCDLARKFASQSFSMWGSGSLLSVLQANKPDNLKLMGAVADMRRYWSQIDVLIICSDDEGFPMVALEAMAAGVPVIALPLGELPSLISHGHNGFIAQDVAELAVYLAKWRSLSAAKQLLIRQHARQTVLESYSSAQLWSRLLPLYQRNEVSLWHR